MRFAKFEPAHLARFDVQPAQRPYMEWMTPEIAGLAAAHFSFTGFDERERVIGCAGLAPVDDDLVAWAMFSERIASHARALTRAVRQGLELHATRRVVAHIAEEHVKAARFAEALDFRQAGRAVHPNGRPILLYVRER